MIRRKTNCFRYKSLDKSIMQKLPGAAKIAGFMRISISAKHSVGRKTSFHYDE